MFSSKNQKGDGLLITGLLTFHQLEHKYVLLKTLKSLVLLTGLYLVPSNCISFIILLNKPNISRQYKERVHLSTGSTVFKQRMFHCTYHQGPISFTKLLPRKNNLCMNQNKTVKGYLCHTNGPVSPAKIMFLLPQMDFLSQSRDEFHQ